MRFKLLTSFMFLVICGFNTEKSFAAPIDTQLNTYTVFDVKQLSFGKNVTVGKYVLAYVPLGERVSIHAANPPQRLDVRLQWLNSKGNHRRLKIQGEWQETENKLIVGLKLGRNLHASKSIKRQAKADNGVILVKGNQPNLISVPLMAGRPIKVFSNKNQFGSFSQKVRVVVSSNKAFQIER